ncbi:lysylphosphatidylglycerol synthase domain-containing protein [Ornithinimicrobium panacihumi]|uniref:lysylphosphatidylglycerol synthase domain-containing protein n=1 Tax=Ornithinimicrobium panacihumi TaxID=2008449 RepID=UPI003F8BF7C7
MTGRLISVLRRPWVRRGFVLAAIAAAVVAVVVQREAVGAALAQTSWPWILVALVLSLVTVALAALSWRSVSAGLGAPLGLGEASVVYLVGQVGKYLPGGVWNVVASAELGSDHGIERRRTVVTMLLAAMISAVVAGAVALVLLPGVPGTPLADHGWLVLLAPLALVAVLPAVLNRILVTLLRVTRQAPVHERIGGRAVLVASAWSLLSWLAVGLQVYVLAVAVGADPGTTTLRLAVGGYALAWIVGFVLVFLPAGVGAREGVLALAMAPVLDTGGVLVVVLLSRVLVTAGDLLAAGVAALLARRRVRAAGPR